MSKIEQLLKRLKVMEDSTPGISDGSMTPPTQQTQPGHTDQRGDNLWDIAQKQLGDATRWKDIYALNKDKIGANPNLIQPGVNLTLPGKATTQTPSPAQNAIQQAAPQIAAGAMTTPPPTPTSTGSKAEQLAQIAANHVKGVYHSNSGCEKGVEQIMSKFGMPIQFQTDAYKSADWLANNPHFQEIDPSQAGRGDISVWDRHQNGASKAGYQSGHIEVGLGGGQGASDFHNLGGSWYNRPGMKHRSFRVVG